MAPSDPGVRAETGRAMWHKEAVLINILAKRIGQGTKTSGFAGL